ncbi:MAG: FkbM family methyltransferase [Flavobacteriaceae bacterium]
MNYFILSTLTRYLLSKLRKYHEHYPKVVVYNKDFIGEEIFAYGMYEKDSIDVMLGCLNFPTQKYSIMDVGANIGNHSLQFSKTFQKVHAFEPNRQAFKLLEINTLGIQNIILHNFGLSHKNGHAFIKTPVYNLGGATVVYEKNNGDNEILLKKGDDCIHEEIAVIKMDIEGHEEYALEGLTETLKKYKPIIFTEYLNQKKEDSHLMDTLTHLGYTHFYTPYRKSLLGKKNPSFSLQFLNGLFFGKTHRIKKIETLKKENYGLLICENPLSKFRVRTTF